MNIFECNAKELVMLSAVIANQISLEYTVEQQEIITIILSSIAENLSIYISVEGFRSGKEEPEIY